MRGVFFAVKRDALHLFPTSSLENPFFVIPSEARDLLSV